MDCDLNNFRRSAYFDAWDDELHDRGDVQLVVDSVSPPWPGTFGQDAALEAWSNDKEAQHEFKALLAIYLHRYGGEVPNGARQLGYGRCFRFLFHLLPPSMTIVPRTFSGGLPQAFGVEWEGNWEVVQVDRSRALRDIWATSCSSSALMSSFAAAYGNDRTLSVAQVSLRSPVGYIRFQRPVIVNRLVLVVPDRNENRAGYICGFYLGAEQWCATVNLETWRANGHSFAEVGNSLHAVDEIAFSTSLEGGAHTLCIALLELSAAAVLAARLSLWTELFRIVRSLHKTVTSGHRHVVLLRRIEGDGTKETESSTGVTIEPVLATLSTDTAVWTLNQIIHSRMRLRADARSPPDTGNVAVISSQLYDHGADIHATQLMVQGLRARRACELFQRFAILSNFTSNAIVSICQRIMPLVLPRGRTFRVWSRGREVPSGVCIRVVWALCLAILGIIVIICAVAVLFICQKKPKDDT